MTSYETMGFTNQVYFTSHARSPDSWLQIPSLCDIKYRKTSSLNRTKSQNLNVSCLLLQWSLPNPLKLGVKLRMKM